jgi:hypothetical protein
VSGYLSKQQIWQFVERKYGWTLSELDVRMIRQEIAAASATARVQCEWRCHDMHHPVVESS